MIIETASIVKAVTTGTATALFKNAAEGVQKSVKGPAKQAIVKVLAKLQGYSEYLEETNERVSTFKNFANPTQPVNLLDHFVTTKFTVKRSKQRINQDDITEGLKRPSRLVISATAGYGKSMVMRYLSLTLFENPIGKIPLFLELRHLNRVTTPDIIAYINASYKRVNDIDVENLKQGLSSGAFVLLLDGFDELNHDIRVLVEQQILSIARDYPKCSIIVSGRPDDRFMSWKQFSVLKICPMEKSSVVELINKLDYDNGVRQRFIKKIMDGLYETHESFLSTPLLAILMLLTYEQNANIPDKIYLFYGKAFETLFHKHDALKEQYDRSRKSELQVDEFENIFSVFCLKTYVEEKTEFTKVEILRSIKDALKYCGYDIKSEDFLFDIEESVCLITKEGNSYFFVHRSFQEYFTALFLSNCAEDIRDEFIDQVSVRHWDSVLPMLFDMASSQLIPSWVSKKCDEYLSEVGYTTDLLPPVDARFSAVSVWNYSGPVHINSFLPGKFSRFLNVMRRFYPELGENFPPISFDKFEKYMGKNWAKIAFHDETKGELEGSKYISRIYNRKDIPPTVFDSTGITQLSKQEFDAIKKISENLDKDQKIKNEFLKKLFK